MQSHVHDFALKSRFVLTLRVTCTLACITLKGKYLYEQPKFNQYKQFCVSHEKT